MTQENDVLCPTTCPFLAMRSFLPNTLPFYCTKYANFLGMSSSKRVQRCSLCLGVNVDLLQTGLALLDAQPTRNQELKQAFLQMKATDQRFLVDLLLKTGAQFNFKPHQRITPVVLLTEALRLNQEIQKSLQSPETQEFLTLLKAVSDSGTPMDAMTQTLLGNLFQVIDASEKGMLLAILENPANLKSFLKQFSKIPQNQSMLKNFRALLYEMDAHNHQKQNNLVHQHLNHLMQKMTQVRLNRLQQRQRIRD